MSPRLHTPARSQPSPKADPVGHERRAGIAAPGPASSPVPKAKPPSTPDPEPPSFTPDPALTGEYGPQPSTSERRRAILPEARAALESAALRLAYEAFVRAAVDLSEAGMIFEMVHRPGAEGGMAPREPRNLSVAAVPEPGIEPGCQTVVLMGVGFWEFLPGFFYGSEQVVDGRRIAMDVGSFRFVERSPSGDAEIIGHGEDGPLAQYMRIDISGVGLVKSLAVSNAALGGAFVAAYRAYIEVLAGCPYKMLHPYRQLSLPMPAPPQQPQPAARPAPEPRQRARSSIPAAWPRPRAAWAWLAVPPALGLAYLLGSQGTPEPSPSAPVAMAPQGQAAPAVPPSLPPARQPGFAAPQPADPARPFAPPAAPQEMATLPPDGLDPVTGLPLPPPAAPPAPPRAAPAQEPAVAAAPLPPANDAAPPASPETSPLTLPSRPAAGNAGGQLGGLWRRGIVRQDANVRAAPFGGSPVLRVVPTGAELRVIEEEQGWLRVALPDGTSLGWIYGALIQ